MSFLSFNCNIILSQYCVQNIVCDVSLKRKIDLLFVTLYYRGGQSAARGPHAALQRFSAAFETNFGYTT